MNTSKNKRYQLTDQKIETAFLSLLEEKDFDSIYVQDICHRAGITRTAFYAHYEDINHLILTIQDEKTKDVSQLLLKNQIPTPETFTSYFQYLKDNKNFYRAFLRTRDSLRTASSKMDSIFEQYPQITEHHQQDRRQLHYHMTFFQAGLMAMSLQWLSDDCPESPAEMANILVDEYHFYDSHNPKL